MTTYFFWDKTPLRLVKVIGSACFLFHGRFLFG
jgi:hypothetical protein